MLRSLFAFAVLATWGGTSFAQTTCDPDTFESTCNSDGTVQICDDVTAPSAPVEAAFNCGTELGAGTCGELGCDGSACADLGVNCIGAATGDECIGFSVYTNQDTADNQLFGAVMCAGDATCNLTVEGSAAVDRCAAHIGPACTAGGEESSCTGTVWTICMANEAGTLALTSNIGVDCSVFDGSVCGEQPCECDAQCGDGSTCTGGHCDFGVTCTWEPDPTECDGAGEGEGEEGEGEGDADAGECASDRDCDDGEVCEDGECVGGTEQPPLCNHSATSAGAPAAGLLALGGLLIGLRRRRA